MGAGLRGALARPLPVLLAAHSVMSPHGFDVGLLSLSLSLEPCEYLSILVFALK